MDGIKCRAASGGSSRAWKSALLTPQGCGAQDCTVNSKVLEHTAQRLLEYITVPDYLPWNNLLGN